VHYDPLLAKVVVHAESRPRAIARMRQALRDFVVLGIHTNIPYLLRILEHSGFDRGDYDTRFLDRETARVVAALAEVEPPAAAFAAAAAAADQSSGAAERGSGRDPWDKTGPGGFSSHPPPGPIALAVDAGPAGTWRVTDAEGRTRRVHTAVSREGIWVHLNGDVDLLARHDRQPVTRASTAAADHELVAPMPATVLSIVAPPGSTVAAGDVLLILEAMKMELPVRAPRAGTVSAVHCREGELVQPGLTLVELS
jgi:3-methylcrotonyl-CoA carboxylase alpha subunit